MTFIQYVVTIFGLCLIGFAAAAWASHVGANRKPKPQPTMKPWQVRGMLWA